MSRPWTTIDWAADRPRAHQIEESHRRLGYSVIPVGGEAVERLLGHLRRVFTNGGALLVGFQVAGNDSTCDWFLSRNRLDEYRFFQHLLSSSALREALPELVGDPAARQATEEVAFKQAPNGAYTLDGWLAATLMAGGAYGRFPGSAAEAKAAGVGAAREIIGDRYDQFVVCANHEPWSDWFGAVAWDTTLMLVDLAQRQVFLLALTDVD